MISITRTIFLTVGLNNFGNKIPFLISRRQKNTRHFLSTWLTHKTFKLPLGGIIMLLERYSNFCGSMSPYNLKWVISSGLMRCLNLMNSVPLTETWNENLLFLFLDFNLRSLVPPLCEQKINYFSSYPFHFTHLKITSSHLQMSSN